jgi:hypothetical protein
MRAQSGRSWLVMQTTTFGRDGRMAG